MQVVKIIIRGFRRLILLIAVLLSIVYPILNVMYNLLVGFYNKFGPEITIYYIVVCIILYIGFILGEDK